MDWIGLGGAGGGPQPQPQQQSLLEMLGSAGGAGGVDPGSLIAKPPEGWQSNAAEYEKAGLGNGWIFGNERENPSAYGYTQAGPQMPHGINPFTDIVYGGSSGQEGQTSGFTLGGYDGPDLFGGRQFQGGNLPRDIPEQLKPWLAPALMRYFYSQGYTGQGGSGVNAPWTGAYAPVAPKLDHPTWPGVARYDPWHRDMGAYANLYS